MEKKEKILFEELGYVELPNGKELVLSQVVGEEGYSLAQRVRVRGDNDESFIYLKNSIHLDDVTARKVADMLLLVSPIMDDTDAYDPWE